MSDRRRAGNRDRQRVAPTPANRNALIRRAELFRVLAYRGGIRTKEEALALCIAMARCGCLWGDGRSNTRGLLWRFADQVEAMVRRAAKYTKMGRGLGKLIGLTEAERVACRAWHLQSVDGATPAEAKASRRKRDSTEGRRERRACKGAKTRAEEDACKRERHAGSERQTEPWVQLGISRRWYYVLKRRGGLVQSAPGSAELVHSNSLLKSSVSALPGALSPPQVASAAVRAAVPAAGKAFHAQLVTTRATSADLRGKQRQGSAGARRLRRCPVSACKRNSNTWGTHDTAHGLAHRASSHERLARARRMAGAARHLPGPKHGDLC